MATTYYNVIRRYLAAIQRRVVLPRLLAAKSSPAVKAAQRQLFTAYQTEVAKGNRLPLSETGFQNYSQFEEDGILLYIFAAIGTVNRTFVDIGSADGVNSNCANLAVNFGWTGLFIDADLTNIRRGQKYYRRHRDRWAYPPKFAHAFIQRENINAVISAQGFTGEVDLVSIDVDGNDYWIWDALSAVEPRVVIIEARVEFGLRSIAVPYDKDFRYPGKNPHYSGASIAAMVKLARRKGYRLVGSNAYGFNIIFVRGGIGEDALPEVNVASVLSHPRNEERFKLFEPISDWEYVEV